mgnify:CR=1 FL=1
MKNKSDLLLDSVMAHALYFYDTLITLGVQRKEIEGTFNKLCEEYRTHVRSRKEAQDEKQIH